jgi:hypothetical protein
MRPSQIGMVSSSRPKSPGLSNPVPQGRGSAHKGRGSLLLADQRTEHGTPGARWASVLFRLHRHPLWTAMKEGPLW